MSDISGTATPRVMPFSVSTDGEARMGGGTYWAIGLADGREVMIYADRIEVAPSGALLCWRETRDDPDQKYHRIPLQAPECLLAFAAGTAASVAVVERPPGLFGIAASSSPAFRWPDAWVTCGIRASVSSPARVISGPFSRCMAELLRRLGPRWISRCSGAPARARGRGLVTTRRRSHIDTGVLAHHLRPGRH